MFQMTKWRSRPTEMICKSQAVAMERDTVSHRLLEGATSGRTAQRPAGCHLEGRDWVTGSEAATPSAHPDDIEPTTCHTQHAQ